jgi:lipopolysaccharide export LptBFGC system permease protein LptF
MWTVLLALFVAAIVVFVSVYTPPTSSPKRETIMAQMDAEPASSYAQKTNHHQKTPVDMGPIAGFETPFRVNMFQAYMT